MQRFVLHSFLKPEKVEEYKKLHADPWPGIMEMIEQCHIHHYSISLRGTELFTYYEYTGDDYEGDMAKMDADATTQEWWKRTKPCFLYHDQGIYYDDLEELFYAP